MRHPYFKVLASQEPQCTLLPGSGSHSGGCLEPGHAPSQKDDPPACLPNVTTLEELFVLILLNTASK